MIYTPAEYVSEICCISLRYIEERRRGRSKEECEREAALAYHEALQRDVVRLQRAARFMFWVEIGAIALVCGGLALLALQLHQPRP